MFKKIITWGLRILVAGIAVILIWGVVDMILGPQVFEHLSAEDAPYDLPKGASDASGITAAAFWPWWAYEFTTSEDAFIEWAKEHEYSLQEIGDNPTHVSVDSRYLGYLEASPDDKENLIIITDGLYHRWEFEDQYRSVIFDRNKKRAYVYVRTR